MYVGLLSSSNHDARLGLELSPPDRSAMHARQLTSDSDVDEVKKPRTLVAAVFLAYVLTRALATVLIYRVQKAMANYTTILMSLYWPVGVLFVCFLLLFCVNRFDLRWFSPSSPQASQEGAVPQRWFVLMAFLNQLCATFSAPPSPFIPVVLQTPLANLVVLWTAIMSFFYLKTRFKMVHYAGICLILCSCVVGVMVELQGPSELICHGLFTAASTLADLPVQADVRLIVNNAASSCVRGLPPYKDSSGDILHIPFNILATMYVFYIVSQMPFAFLNVYKQKKLKEVNLDVAWGYFWQCAWQVMWGLVFIPASWIPWPTPTGTNEATVSSFGGAMRDSWSCFLGHDPDPSITSCSAEPIWGWFTLYLFFNVSCNLCLTWLVKHLSSTWASIGAILCGNVGGFFSQFEIFGGKSAQALSLEQWMALVLSSLAMWIYNMQDEQDVHGRSVYGQRTADTHGPQGLVQEFEPRGSQGV